MEIILERMVQRYRYVIDDLADPRTKDWWMMQSPGPLLSILVTYLFFCNYAGPLYMKDRKPYHLKHVIMAYNLIQILLSVFLAYCGIDFLLSTSYRFRCYNVDYSNTPEGLKWASSVWWYFFAKVTELLDTVFFVLRKKTNQVSFLHLYHHTVMPIIAWIGTKYSPGGQCIVEGGLNSFIHVIMYGYYLVAGLGPRYQKYLWWKKYLTTLQLVQFSIVLYLNINGLLDSHCNYPKMLNLIVFTNCLAFLYMFIRFYYRSYVEKSGKFVKENCDKTEFFN